MPPVAAPEATIPDPPATGIYGLPLQPYGDGMREQSPDGGYIIWKVIKTKNGSDWRPVQPIPPDKLIEA